MAWGSSVTTRQQDDGGRLIRLSPARHTRTLFDLDCVTAKELDMDVCVCVCVLRHGNDGLCGGANTRTSHDHERTTTWFRRKVLRSISLWFCEAVCMRV